MESCKRVREFLPAFMEGEVPEGLKREIEEHLKECPMCRKEKELAARTWAFLKEWPAIEPSPDFRLKFRDRVEAREDRKEKVRWFIRRLAPVLASIFIVSFASFIFIKARIEKINLAAEIDLYQDLEVIENMDLLVELEDIDEG